MALGFLDCIELRYGFSPFSVILTPMQYKYKYELTLIKEQTNMSRVIFVWTSDPIILWAVFVLVSITGWKDSLLKRNDSSFNL